jgi:hypothetical protein
VHRVQATGDPQAGADGLQKKQRPELAQTRAARLVGRGRPPPRALLERHMKRTENWLARRFVKRALQDKDVAHEIPIPRTYFVVCPGLRAG